MSTIRQPWNKIKRGKAEPLFPAISRHVGTAKNCTVITSWVAPLEPAWGLPIVVFVEMHPVSCKTCAGSRITV